MKNKRIRTYIVITAAVIFVAAAAFRGMAAADEGEKYYLLYNGEGTVFQAYMQSEAEMKHYQYKQSMQTIGDIIGNDRTADLHEIEGTDDEAKDVVLDSSVLSVSSDVRKQFTELQNRLLTTINESFEGSEEVKTALIDEVNERLKKISGGDISYLIPLDSYVQLRQVVCDKENPNVISSASLENFIYKKKSSLSIVNGEADFSGKNMTSAILWNKSLDKISLSQSWLCQAVLTECGLSGGDLSESNFLGALFIDCDLRNADLKNANLSGTVFIGSDLTGADLDGVLLTGTVFKSLGEQKVKISRSWKTEIMKQEAEGIEHIEWIG